MNRNSHNFTLLPGARRSVARAHDTHSGYDEAPHFYRSRSAQSTPDYRILGVQDTPRLMGDRTLSGLNRTPSFPAQPHLRQQMNGSNGGMRRGLNPVFGEIVQQSPPRTAENPNSAVLSKLKKEIYEPPKILPKRVSLCYKDSVANALKERDREKQERRKRCAICLEDFEPREEVMLTPCKHVFHEDCIVPWLRSKGQCPVCRFVICEEMNEHASSFNDDIAMLGPNDHLIAAELLSIFGAMEQALEMGG
ncbi:E3 ubiquitin-protein ligase Arkadia-like [Neltuma alba]|uniref:E3 ubiquitin-protein ligase Arkadia-like n=1 Tax=Neltuma alba TaxID=207710 RepID=UPI0010A5269D|nr:E3 ubiquitin-protein ligase Arkadia-like [Prosopis alba]